MMYNVKKNIDVNDDLIIEKHPYLIIQIDRHILNCIHLLSSKKNTKSTFLFCGFLKMLFVHF